ncbi:MAG: ABC transporter permease [Lachnospiraceae bacterium]|nr:ABC transporter permease [Lachnospiraceae bacterium]
MNKVLNKRILRDLKHNIWRYLALFLLIVVGMYIVIAIVGAANTIITGTELKAEENKVEDGQFSVFIPLTEAQEQELCDAGISLERMFSVDLSQEDDSVIRVFANREEMNLIYVEEGKIASGEDEVVLEKRYAEEHSLSVGDTIELAGRIYTVSGVGSVPEYDMPIAKLSDMAVESSLFGLAFVTDAAYEKIAASEEAGIEEYCYAYRLNDVLTHDELKEKIKEFEFDYEQVEDIYFQEMIADTIGRKEELREGIADLADGAEALETGAQDVVEALETMGLTQGELYEGVKELSDGTVELTDGVYELQDETDAFIDEFLTVDIDNLTSFIKAEDNPRIHAAAGDLETNHNIGLVAGVVIMILFTYVISVFVIHQIQQESSVIGTLYALGAKKSNLVAHYILLPTIISFAAGLTGSVLGFSDLGIPNQMVDTYHYFSIPDLEPAYAPWLIVYGVVMPPVISAIVNYIVINKRLSGTALSLIKNEQKVKYRNNISLGKLGFLRRFQIRQMLREARTGITVVLGMFITLLIFMMGLNCYVLCENVRIESVRDAKFEYMYTLKYAPEDVPAGAEACYLESLSKTNLGYTLDVSVIGIDDDNKYYNAKPVKGRSNVVISSSVAQKYNLSVGDKLILTDNAEGMDYAFTVKGIVDYAVGLTVFMDIDSMRELFGAEDDYYNMLLSDHALELEEGRVFSVTEKSDIERSSSVFSKMMKPMVTLLISISVVIFFAVMYLMMNVMIDRASLGISLVKIFGFRTGEIRKLYLNGNTVIVAAGALISIPLAKCIMNYVFPSFIANTSCGVNLTFPPLYYVGIFAGVLVVYFIVNTLLVYKLKKISPAEVLKNRE